LKIYLGASNEKFINSDISLPFRISKCICWGYLVSFANENPQWTTELMGAWLENSQKLVKGSKMRVKVKKEADRENLIAYFQSMGQ